MGAVIVVDPEIEDLNPLTVRDIRRISI